MEYKEEVIKGMNILGENKKVLFMGQSIIYGGSNMFDSLKDVSENKKIELPIIEDTQLGIAIGLSLKGFIPICIYPRFDFLICASNQLINHLDKIEQMSNCEFKPKVIIRTQVGGTTPLYPGLQHCSDYTEGFIKLLKNIKVVKLEKPEDIVLEYKNALNREGSTLLIEMGDLYNQSNQLKKKKQYKK